MLFQMMDRYNLGSQGHPSSNLPMSVFKLELLLTIIVLQDAPCLSLFIAHFVPLKTMSIKGITLSNELFGQSLTTFFQHFWIK